MPKPETSQILQAARQSFGEKKFNESLKQASLALEKATSANDAPGMAHAYKAQGDAWIALQDRAKGIEALQAARATFAKCNDPHGAAESDLSLAVVFGAQDIGSAVEVGQRALDAFARAGEAKWVATTLTVMGGLYSESGRRGEAIACFEKAVEVSKADQRPEIESEALARMGEELEIGGQYMRAIDCYQRSLDAAKASQDGVTEGSRLVSLGIVSQKIGQLRIARSYFASAIELFEKANSQSLLAAAKQNLGSCELADGRLDEAKRVVQEAMALHVEQGDKRGEAGCLGTLGNILRLQRSYAEAAQALDKSAEIFKKEKDIEGQATALDALGAVKLDEGDLDAALVHFESAIKLYATLKSDSLMATSLGNRAETLFQLGKYSEAEKCFQDAVDRYELVRAGLGGLSDAKSSYLNRRVHVYQSFAAVLALQGKPNEAFDVVQKTKARSLLDLLSSGQLVAADGLTQAERDKERELRERADALNARMVKEGVENEVGAKARYAALSDELRKTEDELTKFTTNILAKRPDLANKRVAKTANAVEIGKLLPDDMALVEFLCSEDSVVALVLRKVNGVVTINGHSMAFPSGQMEKRCAEFKKACSSPSGQYENLARNLYVDLVAPFSEDLKGKKKLLICPDAYLWDLPFAALKPTDTSFLADQFEVDYAYSATGALAALSSAGSKSGASGSLLVCANPEFGTAARFDALISAPTVRPIDQPSRPIDQPSRPIDHPSRPIDHPSRPIDHPSRPIDHPSRAIDSLSRGLGDFARGAVIAPLPGTQKEADGLRALVSSATVLSGSEVQESKVKVEMARHRYIHFATHGFLNDTAPLLSSVVLSVPMAESQDDGFLTARELFGLKLDADMVVLSACNSARGEVRSGEGIVGLTWALFVAGCRSQVVSQWSVDDSSTANLMVDFYRGLFTDKVSKGASLAAAMKVLRSQTETRHPYYWAPFILVGDWR